LAAQEFRDFGVVIDKVRIRQRHAGLCYAREALLDLSA
jgi:hypothetical protein